MHLQMHQIRTEVSKVSKENMDGIRALFASFASFCSNRCMTQVSTGLAAEIRRRLELAITAGKEAGRLTLQYFQQDDLQVERKSDHSPVTIADRSAEQLLRQQISASFATDGI